MASQSQTRSERFEGMQQSGQGQRSQGQGQSPGQDQAMQPFTDLYNYFQDYARERPDVAALWCFGIGFVLGWKLKPW
jgi:hypothetical protein